MAASETLQPLPVPDVAMWSSIDVVGVRQLHGGHQSLVFAAERNGDEVVMKLTDSRVVDREFQRRLDTTAVLAEMDELVVGPITTNERTVVELGGWLAVTYPLVTGGTPDVGDEADVRRMASTMARLHRLLRQVDQVDLPTVAGLTGTEAPSDDHGFGRRQLLHGDFSAANLVFSDRQVRVLDFDDCGYGPIEFEVGNTLYMMLFDCAMASDMGRYEHFRTWFVDEYRSASGQHILDEVVEKSIGLRIEALGRWIDQPECAPIGIRTATPAWRQSLREFVRSQGRE